MKKLEYLKLALADKVNTFARKAWYVSAFAIIREGPDDYKKDPYPFRIVQTPTSVSFVSKKAGGETESYELVVIDDAVPGQPLFKFLDEFIVSSDICINASGPIKTTIGTAIFNIACLSRCFGATIPFQSGQINASDIDKVIAKLLTDDPDEDNFPVKPGIIYVRDYIKYVDSLNFLTGLTQLAVYAGSEKTITAAPGLKEFKEGLNKKYEGKLNNPVELARYEGELGDYDAAYLKGDPNDGIFLDNKVKNQSRKKLFLTMGNLLSFDSSLEAKPVIRSLNEGWPTDPEEFTSMVNDLRYGSYGRGMETVKGGVAFKVMSRACSNMIIVPEDCGTVIGKVKQINSSNSFRTEGRYLRLGNKWQLTESKDQAKAFEGKEVMIRSPQYCLASGDSICKYCAGPKLAENPNGLPTALADLAGIILYTSMKVMHGTVLTTVRYDINKVLQ